MPQNVPAFEFSEEAKALRQFVYEHWCRWGRGPNLRAVHEGTGLARRRIVAAYKELQLGIICVVDQDSQNCNLVKFQPFSSYPSQVEVWLEGGFHSYAGCAMEAIAVSRMPPFEGKQITLKSYCACCLAPIELECMDGEVQPADAALVHVSSTPYDWNNDDIRSMCDSMNFVLDAEHAERYERQVSRRGSSSPSRRPRRSCPGPPRSGCGTTTGRRGSSRRTWSSGASRRSASTCRPGPATRRPCPRMSERRPG
jgi:hypothetical protein